MKSQTILKISITVLFAVLFLMLYLQESANKSYYNVLKIISPDRLAVDINHNGTIEKDELIKINAELPKTYSQLQEFPELESMKNEFIYLANAFAQKELYGKKIQIKPSENEYIIFVNNKNYNENLRNSGFVFENNFSLAPENTKKIMNLIKDMEYRVLNQQTNKYHTLDCKYGKTASDYKIIPLKDIPKDALSCNYCHPQFKKDYLEKDNAAITPSLKLSNGFYKIFLTDFTTHLKPDTSCSGDFCRELVSRINSSKTSIDMALYGTDSIPALDEAIKNALVRGVQIRMVYDINSETKNLYNNTLKLAELIKNARSDKTEAIKSDYTMHNKFIIFDDKTVMTGSANISKGDISEYNHNNIIFMDLPEIAAIYKKEFEQMYNGYFHNQKGKIEDTRTYNKENSTVSVYFSPKDKQISKVIIPLIDNAKESILIPTFLITDKNLTQALINARQRGVSIKVIVDAANANSVYSKHNMLRNNGILVKTEIYAGKLHSKTMIIDGKYTVLGSMNFSASGENKNDENTIIIKDREIANLYTAYFNYLWKKIPDKWMFIDAKAEGTDSIGSCTDGVDNNFNKFIDLKDINCQ